MRAEEMSRSEKKKTLGERMIEFGCDCDCDCNCKCKLLSSKGNLKAKSREERVSFLGMLQLWVV